MQTVRGKGPRQLRPLESRVDLVKFILLCAVLVGVAFLLGGGLSALGGVVVAFAVLLGEKWLRRHHIGRVLPQPRPDKARVPELLRSRRARRQDTK